MPGSSPHSDDGAVPQSLSALTLGSRRIVNGRDCFALDVADRLVAVLFGYVDIFVMLAGAADGVDSGRHHLMRVSAGEVIFNWGFRPQIDGAKLEAVPGPHTGLATILLPDHPAPAELDALAPLIDRWGARLAETLRDPLPPRDATILSPGDEHWIESPRRISGTHGLLWLDLIEGSVSFQGTMAISTDQTHPMLPLTGGVWYQSDGARIQVLTTRQALALGRFNSGDRALHDLIWHGLLGWINTDLLSQRQRLTTRLEKDQARLADTALALATTLDPDLGQVGQANKSGASLVQRCCDLVANEGGFTIVAPPVKAAADARIDQQIQSIAVASRLRYRRVTLNPGWWRSGSDHLVAQTKAGAPVALMARNGHYVMIDPASHATVSVDAASGADLDENAWVLYRPFPDQPLSAWDLFRYGTRNQYRGLITVAVTGICASLIGLGIPLASDLVFSAIVPSGDYGQLGQVVIILMIATLATTLFQVGQSLTILRLRGTMDGDIQAAVWDRLLRLPVAFIRRYDAGDLAARAMGVNAINNVLTDIVLNALFSGVFSLFSLALMVIYDAQLAWWCAAMVVLAAAIGFWLTSLQLKYQRQVYSQDGKLSGRVLQYISGIAKLRVAGAEPRAFANWSDDYVHQTKVSNQARVRGYWQSLFNQLSLTASTIGLFALIAMAPATLDIGQFIAFNSAFGTFISGIMGLVGALNGSMAIVPLYERARPILDATPETSWTKEVPDDLSGQIDLDRVSFKYNAESGLVLDNVSLTARPGEFIAIVGPTGAGKSTILRLLLGFDSPSSGTVSYDSRDLNALDLPAVRRQTGVVLQNGQLVTGTIFDNIVGAGRATLDDAWAAAEIAGLATDIRAMPMGMQTLVSEGATTLSGGQRQKMMIARAVIHRPRILLLDEATSALDNLTQKHIADALARFQATRIVIAHRLSTIEQADRIYVMKDGRIVQTGRYSDLVGQPGLFADLARRQIA